MHETALAQNLIQTMCAEIQKQQAKPVSAKISCGVMASVNDQLLLEAFRVLGEGTDCEGLKLRIEHKPLRAKCKLCGSQFDIDFDAAECPDCGGESFDLLGDAPLILEEIEFENGAEK